MFGWLAGVPRDAGRDRRERLRDAVKSLYDLGARQAMAITDPAEPAPVQHRLDLAGGAGFDETTFAQRSPTLRATGFDLPPTVLLTQEIIAQHGMPKPVMPYSGNYFPVDFAGGHDPVPLSKALQTEGVNTCRMRLGKVFKALAPAVSALVMGRKRI
jgi:hypothetical protein